VLLRLSDCILLLCCLSFWISEWSIDKRPNHQQAILPRLPALLLPLSGPMVFTNTTTALYAIVVAFGSVQHGASIYSGLSSKCQFHGRKEICRVTARLELQLLKLGNYVALEFTSSCYGGLSKLCGMASGCYSASSLLGRFRNRHNDGVTLATGHILLYKPQTHKPTKYTAAERALGYAKPKAHLL
jgi:hypothetical protein